MSEELYKYIFVFLTGLLVAYVITPLVIWWAPRIGMVDKPDDRRIHTGIVPRGGGVAVFIGFNLACMAVYHLPWFPFLTALDLAWWRAVLPASVFLLIVGLADDYRGLPPLVKLGGQVVAALTLYINGIHLGSLFFHSLSWPVDCLLTTLWCVGFINAFNLIDGLDGLAAGLGIIAAAGVAGSMLIRHIPGDTLVLLGFIGACLGFLRYNFNPARVFLGDTGSMFIGLTLAAISLGNGSKGTILTSMAIPLLAAGIPILDSAFAVWRRSVRRWRQSMDGTHSEQGNVLSADSDHLHHRLLRGGRSHRTVALMLYALNGGLVIVALLTAAFHSAATAIYLVTFVSATYVIVRHLAHVELWDSGMAVLQGLRRPPSRAVAAMLYPLADLAVLTVSVLLADYLTHPVSPVVSTELSVGLFFTRITIPFLGLIAGGTYKRVWSRARLTEYVVLAFSAIGGILLASAAVAMSTTSLTRLQLGTAGLYAGLAIVGLVGIRIFPRVVQDSIPLLLRHRDVTGVNKIPTLVYGAGSDFTLYMLAKSHKLLSGQPHAVVMGVIDDDPNLYGRTVYGYRVLGGIERLEPVIRAHGIRDIVITTDLDARSLQELTRCARQHSVRVFRWRADVELQPME